MRSFPRQLPTSFLIRGWGPRFPLERLRMESAGVALLQEEVPQRLVIGHLANCCKSGAIWVSARQ
jgi:hypothetical protein